MSFPTNYSCYIFSKIPTGGITPTTFVKQTRSLSEIEPSVNQALIKVTWISMDAAMLTWLKDIERPYVEPVKLGDVMRSSALGVVIKVGEGSKFAVGDEVAGFFGWSEYALVGNKGVRKLRILPGVLNVDYLGVLGTSGLTSYFGLLDIGKPKSGETLVVSGAAGSVGSICCQIGKLKGARVIAIAGGPEKCSWIEKELGVDLALDYKSSNFHERFKKEAGFVDVYFDNVGGEMLNFIMTRMNMKGRIVLCGAISDYNIEGTPAGLTSYGHLIAQRVSIEGFIVSDYSAQFNGAIKELSQWLRDGLIKRKFHIIEGLDNAPKALSMLYDGGSTGKMVVEVSKYNYSL